MKFDYKIFISYRGNSELGCKFAQKLYETIINLNKGESSIGRPFFSKVQDLGNFMDDISAILNNVEYFIIPFDENYLESFLTSGASINADSVTRKEIEVALEKKCKFFLPVSLDGSDLDPIHLKAIYNDYKKISCSKHAFYIDKSLEQEDAVNDLVFRVCEAIYTNQRQAKDKHRNNIYMQFKNESEKNKFINIGADRIRYVNIAATSIASALDIANTYDKQLFYRSWLRNSIKKSKLDVSIVIINPDSQAAIDAAKYKMYPRGLNIPKNKIIRHNLESLLELQATDSNNKIRIYLTDVALPYAMQIVEFPKKKRNRIKVDLYSPFISSDDKRPSFTIRSNKKKTKRLYDFFYDNVDNVFNNSTEIKVKRYFGNWLFDKRIIHRANLDGKYIPMTKAAIINCIDNVVPIEVDISKLADDELWVGRNKIIEINGVEKNISECNRKELEEYRAQLVSNEEFLFLDEFLQLINKQIPVLFEIKRDIDYTIKENKKLSEKMAELFLDKVSTYNGEYAVMSANVYVIAKIKSVKKQVVCGQITLNMSDYQGVSNNIIQLHNENKYIEIFKPDFIACRIEDIKDKYMVTFCVEHDLPLLGWTADSKQKFKLGACCTNLIVENFEE